MLGLSFLMHKTIGQVERGAVRPLGIATQAVHLVGHAADGRIWVQQRALNKANDPGLWDTLMGGMVSAADTVATALVRETWEEARVATRISGFLGTYVMPFRGNLVLAFLATLYPSWRASRVNPAEALRYE